MSSTIKSLVRSTAVLRETQNPTGRIGEVQFAYSKRQRALTVRGIAHSKALPKPAPYTLTMLVRGVNWSETQDKAHPIAIQDKKGGGLIYIEEPTVDHNVQIRCSCPDFYFMWAYADKLQKSLTGPLKPYVRKTPPPPIGRAHRNPTKTPGLCKHLAALVSIMIKQGVLKGTLR